MHLPITPYDDAGPLYGLVWPILISLSVAPSSYFFWANATPDADNKAAAETPPMKLRLLVLNVSSSGSLYKKRVARITDCEKRKKGARNIQVCNVATPFPGPAPCGP